MKAVTTELLDELSSQAAASPRKRAHRNLHESLEAPIHRLLVAATPETYIRPHRHLTGNKFEFTIILRGGGTVIVYDDDGSEKSRIHLVAGGDAVAVEIAPHEWHTFVPDTPNTVFCEVKPGPYLKPPPSDLAPWSRPE